MTVGFSLFFFLIWFSSWHGNDSLGLIYGNLRYFLLFIVHFLLDDDFERLPEQRHRPVLGKPFTAKKEKARYRMEHVSPGFVKSLNTKLASAVTSQGIRVLIRKLTEKENSTVPLFRSITPRSTIHESASTQ